jgi:myo-inositol 2-dehydrogenase/D-chiro-inositol 1-dehydrogenase
VGDISAVFDRDSIDAVFIASATKTHAEHLRRATDVDMAVLCEKSIDLDLDRAVDVIGYVTARSTRVIVNFNRRFDRDHAELKRLVAHWLRLRRAR